MSDVRPVRSRPLLQKHSVLCLSYRKEISEFCFQMDAPLPKDDAAYRRTGKINQPQNKHFNQPSQITMSSASPEPSIISERSRLEKFDLIFSTCVLFSEDYRFLPIITEWRLLVITSNHLKISVAKQMFTLHMTLHALIFVTIAMVREIR